MTLSTCKSPSNKTTIPFTNSDSFHCTTISSIVKFFSSNKGISTFEWKGAGKVNRWKKMMAFIEENKASWQVDDSD